MSKQHKILLVITTVMVFLMSGYVVQAPIFAGSLEPPPGATDTSGNPVPTMKSLDHITPTWSQMLTTSERFEIIHYNSFASFYVLDKQTGLVWQGYSSTARWANAVESCYKKEDPMPGWRMPTIEEIASLLVRPPAPDINTAPPPSELPDGHPFDNVQSTYWSISTNPDGDGSSVYVLNIGSWPLVSELDKGTSGIGVMCVLGGNNLNGP